MANVTATVLEQGAVLQLVVDRPKGNVFTGAVMEEVALALAAHRKDPGLKLVYLTGAGPHFSFGASVEEHVKAQAPHMLTTFHALCRDLFSYPVPVAALVDGKCLGGAFEVALCCHLMFPTQSAVFGCPEIKLGVFPPVLAALGASRLGAPTAEKLLLTGADFAAAAALQCGWASAAVEGDPRAYILTWYQKHLAPVSASSLRQAVAALRVDSGAVLQFEKALAAAEKRYVSSLLETHDANEGIEAFLARRPAVWRDA